MSKSDTSNHPARLVDAVRGAAPLVHNISNLVVQNDTADAIAAVGGTQITLHTEEEAEAVGAVANALAVNPGTLDESWRRCALQAVGTATQRRTPWVLDPVAAGLSDYRRRAAEALLALGPSVLKANASEILVLAGEAASGRAADSIHSVSQATAAARDLARRHRCVVVVTGAEDLITDGDREVALGYGHPLMGQMVGSGCMLTAVIGCFLAVADSAFEAAEAAVAGFTLAGEAAADRADGPGTLKPLFIDALFHLDSSTLQRRMQESRE
jgi:hydroxyethylthiazole kinase